MVSPPEPAAVHCVSRIVAAADLDEQGRVGNAAYLPWLQDAAVAHSAARGWSAQRYQALGASWVVRRHEIDYLLPALEGDALQICTWINAVERLSALRRYEVRRAGDRAVVLRALTRWVFVDVATERPLRIPAQLRDDFLVDPRNEL